MPLPEIRIPDPTFLLSLYNKNVREGSIACHPWQVKVHRAYADENFDYRNKVKRIIGVANNGSGKSAMVIAPCSVWTGMRYNLARSVVTSGSGVQLDRQVGRSITHLCEQINLLHDDEIWRIKYREYTNTKTNSIIELYATDEPGKAEGYHALETGKMFAMFPDEAKSIPDTIFEAISRCNGMTHFMPWSSPGAPHGFFYRAFTSGNWQNFKVTAYDCPHIKQDEIDNAKEIYGEYSAFFRSAYLAEFTSVDEQVVIPYERIYGLLHNLPSFLDDNRKRCGVDLSGGGDENVVSVWIGNKQVALECFKFSDTRATRIHLCNIFKKWSLKGNEIAIDDGNVGRAIISELRDHGYDCIPVRFGSKAYRSIAYGNRGTELWFNFSMLLPHLLLMDDKTQTNQLSSRYYKQSDSTGKIILESKREAKANGHNSPDRADATVLAWSTTPPNYFTEFLHKPSTTVREVGAPIGWVEELLKKMQSGETITDDELAAAVDNYRNEKAAKEQKAIDDARRHRFGTIQSNSMSRMLGLGSRIKDRFTNILRKQ